MDRIWVIGETGQIGNALVRLLGESAISPSAREIDLSLPDRVAGHFDRLEVQAGSPVAVVNAAAYTQVDQAEGDESVAFKVNAEAPGEMARWCQRRAIPFLHYSTDYVYRGNGTSPWREDDPPDPLNAYGRTKLKGDQLVEASGARYLIFRTSWVYDARGRNFFNTILRLGQEREALRVVADQIGAPTYAPHLAHLTVAVLNQALRIERFPSGIYHAAHGGAVSWHGFAEAICAAAENKGLALKVNRVDPVPTAEYPTAARRPLNSRLDTTKLETVFGSRLPEWRRGLDECMEEWMAFQK